MTPRDPERIGRVLDALRQAWEQHPDWRLGQLVHNAASAAAAEGAMPPYAPLFYLEEKALLKGLSRLEGH